MEGCDMTDAAEPVEMVAGVHTWRVGDVITLGDVRIEFVAPRRVRITRPRGVPTIIEKAPRGAPAAK